jgi:hypothetical protein
MADLKMRNYEEVAQFQLDRAACERLLKTQTECTFCWRTAGGWPLGIIMSYVWRDDQIWMTASAQRPRVAAVRLDDRVSVVVSSAGTSLPPQTVTLRGRCRLLDDAATKAWFYPALAEVLIPGDTVRQGRFVAMLDSPRRVIMAVRAEKLITFDSEKMGQYWRGGAEPPK